MLRPMLLECTIIVSDAAVCILRSKSSAPSLLCSCNIAKNIFKIFFYAMQNIAAAGL